MKEKTLIKQKIKDKSRKLEDIATEFGYSIRTLYSRMEEYGIKHGRIRGRKKGQKKPNKLLQK